MHHDGRKIIVLWSDLIMSFSWEKATTIVLENDGVVFEIKKILEICF